MEEQLPSFIIFFGFHLSTRASTGGPRGERFRFNLGKRISEKNPGHPGWIPAGISSAMLMTRGSLINQIVEMADCNQKPAVTLGAASVSARWRWQQRSRPRGRKRAPHSSRSNSLLLHKWTLLKKFVFLWWRVPIYDSSSIWVINQTEDWDSSNGPSAPSAPHRLYINCSHLLENSALLWT